MINFIMSSKPKKIITIILMLILIAFFDYILFNNPNSSSFAMIYEQFKVLFIITAICIHLYILGKAVNKAKDIEQAKNNKDNLIYSDNLHKMQKKYNNYLKFYLMYIITLFSYILLRLILVSLIYFNVI